MSTRGKKRDRSDAAASIMPESDSDDDGKSDDKKHKVETETMRTISPRLIRWLHTNDVEMLREWWLTTILVLPRSNLLLPEDVDPDNVARWSGTELENRFTQLVSTLTELQQLYKHGKEWLEERRSEQCRLAELLICDLGNSLVRYKDFDNQPRNNTESEILRLVNGSIRDDRSTNNLPRIECVLRQKWVTIENTDDIWVADSFGSRGVGEHFVRLPTGSTVRVAYRHSRYHHMERTRNFQSDSNASKIEFGFTLFRGDEYDTMHGHDWMTYDYLYFPAWIVKTTLPETHDGMRLLQQLDHVTNHHKYQCTCLFMRRVVANPVMVYTLPCFSHNHPLFLSNPNNGELMLTNPMRTILWKMNREDRPYPMHYDIRYTFGESWNDFFHIVAGYTPDSTYTPQFPQQTGRYIRYDRLALALLPPQELHDIEKRRLIIEELDRVFIQLPYLRPIRSMLKIVNEYICASADLMNMMDSITNDSTLLYTPTDEEYTRCPSNKETFFVYHTLYHVLKRSPFRKVVTTKSRNAIRGTLKRWSSTVWCKLVEEKVASKQEILSPMQTGVLIGDEKRNTTDTVRTRKMIDNVWKKWKMNERPTSLNAGCIVRVMNRMISAVLIVYGYKNTLRNPLTVSMTGFLSAITKLRLRMCGIIVEYAFFPGAPDNDGDTDLIRLKPLD